MRARFLRKDVKIKEWVESIVCSWICAQQAPSNVVEIWKIHRVADSRISFCFDTVGFKAFADSQLHSSFLLITQPKRGAQHIAKAINVLGNRKAPLRSA